MIHVIKTNTHHFVNVVSQAECMMRGRISMMVSNLRLEGIL